MGTICSRIPTGVNSLFGDLRNYDRNRRSDISEFQPETRHDTNSVCRLNDTTQIVKTICNSPVVPFGIPPLPSMNDTPSPISQSYQEYYPSKNVSSSDDLVPAIQPNLRHDVSRTFLTTADYMADGEYGCPISPLSLRELCARKLCQYRDEWVDADKQNEWLNISAIPPGTSQLLFDMICKHKLLTDNVMIAFHQCHIHCVNLGRYPKVSDSWIRVVATFSGLVHLDISHAKSITDDGFVSIMALGYTRSYLEILNVECCVGLTDRSVVPVIRSMSTSLRELNLSGCVQLTDATLSEVIAARKLRSLSLSRCQLMTSKFLCQIGLLRHLRSLDISLNPNVDDIVVSAFRPCSSFGAPFVMKSLQMCQAGDTMTLDDLDGESEIVQHDVNKGYFSDIESVTSTEGTAWNTREAYCLDFHSKLSGCSMSCDSFTDYAPNQNDVGCNGSVKDWPVKGHGVDTVADSVDSIMTKNVNHDSRCKSFKSGRRFRVSSKQNNMGTSVSTGFKSITKKRRIASSSFELITTSNTRRNKSFLFSAPMHWSSCVSDAHKISEQSSGFDNFLLSHSKFDSRQMNIGKSMQFGTKYAHPSLNFNSTAKSPFGLPRGPFQYSAAEMLDNVHATAKKTPTGLPGLQKLNLSYCGVTDVGCASISCISTIISLDISQNQITAKGVNFFVLLSRLEELDISYCTDAGGSATNLTTLLNLKKLNLYGVSRLNFENDASWPCLRYLDISRTNADDRVVSAIVKAAPLLEELALRECTISQSGAESLAKLKGLVRLDVGDTDLSNSAVLHLASLTELVNLNLFQCHVNAATLPGLMSKFAKLQRLNLDTIGCNEACIKMLNPLQQLVHLDLFGARITDRGCVALLEAGLPHLESLEICGGLITDKGVEHICELVPKLVRLNLSQNEHISDKGVVSLSRAFRLSIKALRLSNTGITNGSVKHLCICGMLEELVVRGCNISESSLCTLRTCLHVLWHLLV